MSIFLAKGKNMLRKIIGPMALILMMSTSYATEDPTYGENLEAKCAKIYEGNGADVTALKTKEGIPTEAAVLVTD